MDLKKVLELIDKLKLSCAATEAGTGRWKGLDDLQTRIEIEELLGELKPDAPTTIPALTKTAP